MSVTSAVHYKFKSARDFDTITFEGSSISVDELKKRIVDKQRLVNIGTKDDLVFSDAQSSEIYRDDRAFIPRNTSLIVRRVPKSKASAAPSAAPPPRKSVPPPVAAPRTTTRVEPAATRDGEIKGIHALVNSAESEWHTQSRTASSQGRGSSTPFRGFGSGRSFGVDMRQPPPNYVCHRCGQRGHFINQCPTNDDPTYDVMRRPKRPVGIPRAFLKTVDPADAEGAMLVSGGVYAVAKPNEEVFRSATEHIVRKGQQRKSVRASSAPEQLKCTMCKNLLRDAVMVSCCYRSFCSECITKRLLDERKCPSCGEEQAVDSLLPNETLRTAVKAFVGSATDKVEKAVEKEPEEGDRKRPADTERDAPAKKSRTDNGQAKK